MKPTSKTHKSRFVAMLTVTALLLLYFIAASGVLYINGKAENTQFNTKTVATYTEYTASGETSENISPSPLVYTATENITDDDAALPRTATTFFEDNVTAVTDAAGISTQKTPDADTFALYTPGHSHLSVYDASAGTTVDMPLEEYVTGVLLAEMPTSYEHEALKAQAVAIRTYTVYKLVNGTFHTTSPAAALCTDSSHCQAYTSPVKVSEERRATAKKAVDDTAGIIMYHDGKPILAVFHAASLGSTRSSAQVWGGELAYLSPVETWEDENPAMAVTATKGHGVGMSQYGAQDLAQKGYDFRYILSHYYTGINFGTVGDTVSA